MGLLVQEECTEDERKLFKLDSILTAIGLQGEEAVFDVLKQHERNPSKVKNFVKGINLMDLAKWCHVRVFNFIMYMIKLKTRTWQHSAGSILQI